MADAVNAAQIAAKAGNYGEAIAKAKEADEFQPKPPQRGPLLHAQIVARAQASMDYDTAIAMLDRMIAAREGNMAANLAMRDRLRSVQQTR